MDKYRCLHCHKNIALTTKSLYRKHKRDDADCPGSGTAVPLHVKKRGPETSDDDKPVLGRDYAECPECKRTPIVNGDGTFTDHYADPETKKKCEGSGQPYEPDKEGECQSKADGGKTDTTPSQELTNTPQGSPRQPNEEQPTPPPTVHTPEGTTGDAPPVPVAAPETPPTGPRPPDTSSANSAGPTSPERTDSPTAVAESPFSQPASPFAQPSKAPRVATEAIPMTPLGQEIATRFKEIFYAYSNRLDRSVQATLGPSEIGTPCDRRIAMSLMRIPAVNPGRDNWASFVGTCVHTGLADMFEWADAGQGRFAVEVPLTFQSHHVPKGTSDLLDRAACVVADHKLMGRWSLDKLKTKGPTDTYRIQAHVYGYGMKQKGEKVRDVAVIGWPRENPSLDDLYVWTERYDSSIAKNALARVDKIALQAEEISIRLGTSPGGMTGDTRHAVAKHFPIDTSERCSYCPFYAKGDANLERGCNGKPAE